MARLPLGHYPTPLRRCPVPGARGELWVKDDGDTAELYGGNKVRKLESVLAAARARGARRIVTFGAGGSHHASTHGSPAPTCSAPSTMRHGERGHAPG